MSAAYKPRCNVADCIQPIFRAGYCVDHYRQHGVAAGKSGAGASEAKSEHLEQFRNLCQESTSDQMSLFLKSFIFDLEENWKDVVNLEAQFRKRVADSNEGKDDLNPVMAADFLQKHGHGRTAVQRKEEIADIDLDKNDRISFIEYLLLHYKVMILKAYYKRVGQDCPYDLSRGGIGVAGVGAQLLDELFTMPMGLDPALEKAIEEFTATKKAREAKIKTLNEKAAEGGVKGLAASNEIKQLESQDLTEMNRLEITLNAAKKRAARDSGEVALKKKKDAEEAEKKAKQDAGRNKLKDMAARWNTPQ